MTIYDTRQCTCVTTSHVSSSSFWVLPSSRKTNLSLLFIGRMEVSVRKGWACYGQGGRFECGTYFISFQLGLASSLLLLQTVFTAQCSLTTMQGRQCWRVLECNRHHITAAVAAAPRLTLNLSLWWWRWACCIVYAAPNVFSWVMGALLNMQIWYLNTRQSARSLWLCSRFEVYTVKKSLKIYGWEQFCNF